MVNEDPLSLARLHDIVEPAATSIWPPASGLWLVVVFVVVWVVALLGMYLIHRRRNAYRRQALHILGQLRPRLADPQQRAAAVAELADLLKRTALAGFPRHEVASLTGQAWLAFLDGTGGGSGFSDGPGRVIASVPFEPGAAGSIAKQDCEALVSLARSWIDGHEAPA